jgi:hypothetical protein
MLVRKHPEAAGAGPEAADFIDQPLALRLTDVALFLLL